MRVLLERAEGVDTIKDLQPLDVARMCACVCLYN